MPPAAENDSSAVAQKALDDRVLWIVNKLSALFRVPEKDLAKVVESEDFRTCSTKFFDTEDARKFYVVSTSPKEFTFSLEPPESIPRKGIFMYKVVRAKISPQNIAETLVYGDIDKDVLENLNLAVDGVFVPMMAKSKVLTKDLVQQFNKFISSITVTKGQSQGKTVLPLPKKFIMEREDLTEKDKIYTLETAVVQWTGQIREVLKRDPEGMHIDAAGGLQPGPLDEIKFWKSKSDNLELIDQQLKSDAVNHVIADLQSTNSSYLASFLKIREEVTAAHEEALNNFKFLNPLKTVFEQLRSSGSSTEEFNELRNSVFRKLFHSVFLVWTKSKYYNKAGRLVVLMREICNDLIEVCRTYVNCKELFTVESAEAIDKLKNTLTVCGAFKQTYFDYRARVQQTTPDNPWRIQMGALFHRLDMFLERVRDMLELIELSVMFSKLSSIKIGGSKGSQLSQDIAQIYEEFKAAFDRFKEVTYDMLNIDQKLFEDDFHKFKEVVKEQEGKIGTIMGKGFAETSTIESSVSLIESFHGFLEREIIQRELEKKELDIIERYTLDLKNVQHAFQKFKDSPPVSANLPPTAGALIWSNGLLERILSPLQKVKEVNENIIATTEGKNALALQQSMVDNIRKYQHAKYDEWAQTVADICSTKLQEYLLKQDEKGMLVVNFDPHLVRLLREVNYFEKINTTMPEADRFAVPADANSLFARFEEFRQQINNLEVIKQRYNQTVSMLIPVEKPLLQKQLDDINAALQEGLTQLTWNSPNKDAFIDKVMAMALEANKQVDTLKNGVDYIRTLLKSWKEKPFFEYNEGRPMQVSAFVTKYAELKKGRCDKVLSEAPTIGQKLEECFASLKNIEKQDQIWQDYVTYVSDIVHEGLVEFVLASLEVLRNQIDSEYVRTHDGVNSLLEIQLRLEKSTTAGPLMIAEYSPPIAQQNTGSLKTIILSWIADFLSVASFVPKLNQAETNYLPLVKDDARVQESIKQVGERIRLTAEDGDKFNQQFRQFSFLYEQERGKAFAEFLEKNNQLEKQDFKSALAEYQKQIVKYEKLEEQIAQLPTSNSTDGWLRIDSKPIKTQLKDICIKWKTTFTNHLSQKVESSLSDLYEFMNTAQQGLDMPVADGDTESLKSVMGFIRQVKTRVEGASQSGLFEPLRQIIALLKERNCDVKQELSDKLEVAPELWKALYQKSLDRREKLSTLQDREANKIKDQMLDFSDRVRDFRAEFDKSPAFFYVTGTTKAYPSIDEWYRKIIEVQKDASQLNHLQELFDLMVIEYKDLKTCMEDVKLLKQLWDMVMLVQSLFADWTKTPFVKADVGFFLEETKKLLKTANSFPMKMKSWKSYSGMMTELENMKTSLPLILSLRDPAMRTRHWTQLLKETHKQGMVNPEDENFSLSEFMELGLHEYEETVLNIVEKATKELSIENQLNKISNIWKDMPIEFKRNEELNCPILGSIEEIIENLEDNQVKLQNLAGNRFVEFFVDKVSNWQTVLGTVDTVINLWMEVQKTWENLYPIFVLSEDIKVQLPADAKRFSEVDEEWRKIMDVAQHVTIVIDACYSDTIQKKVGSKKPLQELLSEFQEKLEMCQKSLNEYLEKKRKAFPRFYFVAPADLVDILSKGSFPRLIMRHMSKLVDAIATLTFKEDQDVAVGMVSVDDEVVDFTEEFKCEGAVENWLTGVLNTVKKTLQVILHESHQAYMEMTRDNWLRTFPAQLVIVASRIYFTSDVNSAFDRYEEGNKNALKDYSKVQVQNLAALTQMVQGNLDRGLRKKIITLITVDVHNRDIVMKLIDEKAESASVFTWQSQLRYTLDDKRGCIIDIADARFTYNYEYIGNCGCLVITPLTDRCYITLTQSLRLILGGAPAGPAGTGKTETTKDLGRALGTAVYVFNCTAEMDYLSLGNIFKGLAMTGAWGCFDEFNRVRVGVLSVVATQFKSILDAIRSKKEIFSFQGEMISLIPTIGAFITMNPGYKGRTELPENLKALFRPCAMVVPDLLNICEIMLAAEGFIEAKPLAKKFVTLYKLNRELLSKQDHYDWGLRAIKSVLVIAGSLKRAEPSISEEKILMRALRDTNMAKLARDDIQIFLRLISDLFPGLEIEAKQDPVLEAAVQKAVKERKLQRGDNDLFVKKAIQLKELLDVRHSVFVLGPAGAAKTCLWKTLQHAIDITVQNDHKRKTIVQILDPKAVTSFELYGYIHPQTREWKDGLLSNVMRELAQNKNRDQWKWIVLDGDIDTEWIESMNTVMDDNKVLTLASNERIPLTPSMRLLFEISHLRNASPATVSRAGILFLNESDIGWGPFKDSWVESRGEQKDDAGMNEQRGDEREKQALDRLFDIYVQKILDHLHVNQKHIIPVSDMCMITNLCNLLEGLITEETCPYGKTDNVVYEMYFMFACVWAFGGALPSDVVGGANQRERFSTWWRRTFTNVKFPEAGSVFDYYVDDVEHVFKPWDTKVKPYEPSETAFSDIIVSTSDNVRLNYIMDILLKNQKSVMFVGTAGTGKTSIVKGKLTSLDPQETLYSTINFNSMTDSKTLQSIMEQSIEKKAGKRYGPPGRKKLIFFIDDLNMPNPDKYQTQSAICLVRQHMDHGFWYDQVKMIQKEVVDVNYLAAMNPKSGSFTVDDRLQRHYCILACNFPSRDDLTKIYGQIMQAHLSTFDASVRALSDQLVKASINLHKEVSNSFQPNAVKFHYQFNLRELSNIFQGLCQSNRVSFKQPAQLVRLWFHECFRVFSDRMISETDVKDFRTKICKIADESFEGLKSDQVLPKDQPLIFTSFMEQSATGERIYVQAPEYEKLKDFLEKKLEEYNSDHQVMDLVLFVQAIEHICRISRVIQSPRGNALLVGVGGSGKQSLARLASFINQYEIFQIVVTSNYSMMDFKTALMTLYKNTGQKGMDYSFILTDSQIINDKMLVYVNDLLSSGYIPELFTPDERDQMIQAMTNEAKNQGRDFTNPKVVWEFFLERVRNSLHVILCFSPVGPQFRNWCRKFPALINCTSIDWFHKWPRDALISVASRFLDADDLGGAESKQKIAEHMAFVHESVELASEQYKLYERRHNYVTPKSFLELIELYKSLLKKKRSELYEKIDRLNAGLYKLRESSEKVADLQVVLKQNKVIVEQRKVAVDELLKEVTRDRAFVEEQQAIATTEQTKTNKIVDEVQAFADECAADLQKAQPIIDEAMAALNTLDIDDIRVLKSLTKPPDGVDMVTAAVMILQATRGVPKDVSWQAAKNALMKNPKQMVESLIAFDKEHIPQQNVDVLEAQYLKDERFKPDTMASKSSAAAGLCKWVINIVQFHKINCDVEPKRIKMKEAEERLNVSKASLKKCTDKVKDLTNKLNQLLDRFNTAEKDKQDIEDRARKTEEKLQLAERLVNGLGDENVRWAKQIGELQIRDKTLVGDVLLAAAFLSYLGAFSKAFRDQLLKDKWLPDLQTKQIPTTQGIDPLFGVLTDDAEIALWNNEGLPADRISIENGAIVCNCKRWPLLIDPQLQGIKWIKNKESKRNLKIVQLSQPKYLDVIEDALQNGYPVLLQNVGETLDSILDPILTRSFTRRGRQDFIKLGDKEIEYDHKFKLYIQTKLSNPHYRPEIVAQTTLLNFMVTEEGLEDQLLAVVVNKERPDLEAQRVQLLRQMNQFKIDLKRCEDDLLRELSNAEGDILENKALIENLENTKIKATEIAISVKETITTTAMIEKSRQVYRPVAMRGSLIFFQINLLSRVDYMYQYSLEAFMVVFNKALDKAKPAEKIEERVANITDSITETVFSYVSRGLFARHKLIFSTMIAFAILKKNNEINPQQLDFLLRAPQRFPETDSEKLPEVCRDWCNEASWNIVLALAEIQGTTPSFDLLPHDLAGSYRRWKEWCDFEQPEDKPLPLEWKNLDSFQRLLIIRALRPDRIITAMQKFVAEKIGSKYVMDTPVDLAASFSDAGPTTPIFFILSPGVDPVKSVEQLGTKYGINESSFKNVSLGQGQEVIAEAALEHSFKTGGWVMLNNIHLTPEWLGDLEKKLDKYSEIFARQKMQGDKPADEHEERGHPDFRVFLSAEPSENIPLGILQRSIKLTNEPPSGLRANLVRAFMNFDDQTWEASSKQAEFKAVLFSLCFFHSVIVERKKFGPQGWNRNYPFNLGDLTTCVAVLFNYLEDRPKVPWDDLRYVFGEIMYGGHITDDWDRRLCMTYLAKYIDPKIVETIELFQGFQSPPTNLNYAQYMEYIDTVLPPETPNAFGLDANAEIGFRTVQGETLFNTLVGMQPRTEGAGGEGKSDIQIVRETIQDMVDRLPEAYNLEEIGERLDEDRTPYQNSFLQECEYMNRLLAEVKRSLVELDKGVTGELSMSDKMQELQNCLLANKVPETWSNIAYPSIRPLNSWYKDLLARNAQLVAWTTDLQTPKCVWISGFFNPQSFLTAIMQTTARAKGWPLDKMTLVAEVTKKMTPEEVESAPREGAFVYGMFLEGATWDIKKGALGESKLKDLYPKLPVLHIKAVQAEKTDPATMYECPCYKTPERSGGFVFSFNLKTSGHSSIYVLKGVSALLDVNQ